MKRLGLLFLFIVICLSIGWAGGTATQSSLQSWHAFLVKPPLTPPNWVFAPVWTTLYLLMAVAGWRLWIHPASNPALKILFGFQLAFNALWSYLFFGLRNPGAGLADIVVLWLCLAILVRLAWRAERSVSVLLMPYLAWVSFATYLNAGYWWLNR